MASTYSSNLGIELIGTGDQSGTWGSTTNTNLGTLIEQAISGYVTQAVTTGMDTTITIPNGSSGVARNMYIELTGSGGASTNLIVPANKKLYFIFNNTSSGQVTVKVSGQTGISVPNGKKMILVSNGTDIVTAENYVASLSSDNLTLTGNLTLSGGTANGVLYLNGSKVATSGSALTFDGTNFGVGTASYGNAGVINAAVGVPGTTAGGLQLWAATTSNHFVQFGDGTAGDAPYRGAVGYNHTLDSLLFYAAGAEKAVLNSTGLGIGTSSPAYKLDVRGSTDTSYFNITSTADANSTTLRIGTDATAAFINATGSSSGTLQLRTYGTTRATLDSSGNLGLGVTPSAWDSGRRVFQIGGNGALWGQSSGSGFLFLSNNLYYDGTNFRYLNTAASAYYTIASDASHRWYQAVSGTAGNVITVGDPKMILDSSGNLGLGTASPAAKLDVAGTIRATGAPVDSIYTGTTAGSVLGSFRAYGTGAGVTGETLIRGVLESGSITSSYLEFGTASSGTLSEKMRITSSGNLGLGVTPSAWYTLSTVFQSNGYAFEGRSGTPDYSAYWTNAYLNAAGSAFIYRSNGYASVYLQASGVHRWRTAASGTAGGTISFTETMTLDASGNLGVGTTSPAAKLHVYSGSGPTTLRVQRTTVPTFLTDCQPGATTANSLWSINIENTSNGSSSWGSAINSAYSCAAIALESNAAADSKILFYTAAAANTAPTERARITSDGRFVSNAAAARISVEPATGTNSAFVSFTSSAGANGSYVGIDSSAGGLGTGGYSMALWHGANYPLVFATNNTERGRFTAGGDFLVGKQAVDSSTAGCEVQASGQYVGARNGLLALFNRLTTDGDLISFRQDGTEEGSISVSGNTVSYNAFAGSHWSQLQDGSKPDILRGTVMESINELCVWPGEQNERLPKSKISDTASSKKVYGVFMAWDNDWTETNDMLITSVGAFICRVNGSVTVQEGDLLESNGDGTARVQADDIIRSSTIGKVTSTVKTHQYDDGSYCVPTVLYCG